MKIIELKFEDGERWEVPLEFVAKHRADYYKSKRKDDFDYQSEIDFVIHDDYEGHNWLQNNMDFEDFKEVVKIIPNTEPQTKDWINAEVEIKEVAENKTQGDLE